MPKTASKSCIPGRIDREDLVTSRPMVRPTILRAKDALEVLGRVSRDILASYPGPASSPTTSMVVGSLRNLGKSNNKYNGLFGISACF